MAVVIKTILTIVFAIASVILIVIVLKQEGKQSGLGALSGSAVSTDTYWGKNKGRSAEGKLKKATRILAILFVVLAVVLNISF